jgi:hypothetical protein
LAQPIDEVNGLDAEQLRERYRELLENNELSEKGTAGLGFIDISRKTGQKMFYKFESVDDLYSHFYFETRVMKEYPETSEKTSRRMSRTND